MRSSSDISESAEEITIEENQISQGDDSISIGELTVVGIGPGSLNDMTPRAFNSIRNADVVVGYNAYITLIKSLIEDKEVIGTAMLQEIDRCKMAVEKAISGQKVVVVSSGDPGIYGMAGLVLELVMQLPKEKQPKVEVVPGISAVSASAAILGAPLMHDFAVISLSDLLTPWDLIKKRAELVAQGDFVVALYNPKSKKRVNQIEEIREIMLKFKDPQTPVGIVNNATREKEYAIISNLNDFTKETIDMFSLVIIGNSNTYVEDGKIITPRGYKI
ncbi:MAG: precorrin-3B C(17)-methyltransferase [Negativicutes bacterium]|nr:precorrin-3B C(17)-methyltransferase [Negativicutes bacterium]MBP9537697.1 precorrin-3B C(17)-methyltransferase [Negativicutes bacterium]MBP9949010.1 precorrin-3B C(17)-methyltransferase [Negativicutes bacterium]